MASDVGSPGGVWTPPAREIFQHFDDIIHFFIVNHLRVPCPCHLQTFGKAVDRNHALCSEKEGTADGELPHRAATPDGNHIARFDVAVLRGHVSGRENVRQKQDLFVVQLLRDLDRSHIRERHTRVLRLASRVTSQHVGISE